MQQAAPTQPQEKKVAMVRLARPSCPHCRQAGTIRLGYVPAKKGSDYKCLNCGTVFNIPQVRPVIGGR